MLLKQLSLGACSALILSLNFSANAEHNHGVISPIGVMADHDHDQGEWMISHRYSSMKMDGNRDGTNDVSTAEVLNNYMVAPLDMTMEMHMFGAMYGVNDKITLMGMLPYVKKSMNHVTRMGTNFKTETKGIGDAKISAIYRLRDNGTEHDGDKILLNFGASLPTGSTDERGTTPMGPGQKLPYPMQLGSGTIDPIAAITYVKNKHSWAYGAQGNTVLRFGKNDEGYRLGNEYGATTWVSKNIHKNVGVSFRLDGKIWNDIKGQDGDLNSMVVPTADANLRGGKRVDALVGINLLKPDNQLAGSSFGAEFGMPIYQNLDGPQLETDYKFTVGLKLAF